MANDFKRFCVPNVSNSSNTTLYAVPAGASSAALESIVIGITMANKSNSGITGSIFIDNEDGSNDVYIVKGASIPAGASLEVMDRDATKMRGERPFVFSNLKSGQGVQEIVRFIIEQGMLRDTDLMKEETA